MKIIPGILRDLLESTWWMLGAGRVRWSFTLWRKQRLDFFRHARMMVARDLPLSEGFEYFAKKSYFLKLVILGIFGFFYILVALYGFIDTIEDLGFLVFFFVFLLTLPLIMGWVWENVRTILYYVIALFVLFLLFLTVTPTISKNIFELLIGEQYVLEVDVTIYSVTLIVLAVIISFLNRYHKVNRKMLFIADKLGRGESLSGVCRKYIRSMMPFHLSLLETGEKTGRLKETLDLLIDYESKYRSWILQRVIIMALYPIALFLVSLLYILFLMYKIRPKFEDIPGNPNPAEIPIFTTITSITDTIFMYWHRMWEFIFTLPGALIFIVAVIILIYTLPTVFHLLPVFGRISRRIFTAQLLAVLGYSIRAGLTVDDALEFARTLPGKDFLRRKHFTTLKTRILAGNKISDVFEHSPIISPDAAALVRIAEDADCLEQKLPEISRMQFEHALRSSKKIGTYFEPALHILVAAGIALVVMSFYGMLFRIPLMGT